MTKNKWIVLAVCVVAALLVIGGFVWFLKSATWIGGVYYLVSLIVVAVASWFLKGKWDEHQRLLKKEVLHD